MYTNFLKINFLITLLLLIFHKNILFSYGKLISLRIEGQSPSIRKSPFWRFLLSKKAINKSFTELIKRGSGKPNVCFKAPNHSLGKADSHSSHRTLKSTRDYCFMVASWAASIWNTMGDPRSSPLTGEEFQSANLFISSFSAVVVSFVKSKAFFSFALLPQKWRLLVSLGLWDMVQLMQTLKTAACWYNLFLMIFPVFMDFSLHSAYS